MEVSSLGNAVKHYNRSSNEDGDFSVNIEVTQWEPREVTEYEFREKLEQAARRVLGLPDEDEEARNERDKTEARFIQIEEDVKKLNGKLDKLKEYDEMYLDESSYRERRGTYYLVNLIELNRALLSASMSGPNRASTKLLVDSTLVDEHTARELIVKGEMRDLGIHERKGLFR